MNKMSKNKARSVVQLEVHLPMAPKVDRSNLSAYLLNVDSEREH